MKRLLEELINYENDKQIYILSNNLISHIYYLGCKCVGLKKYYSMICSTL